MAGTITKFGIWENKSFYVDLDVYAPRTVAAIDEALQVVQMFSGDGGKISDIGDDDLDAGAGDGAMEQMTMPLETV